MRILLVEDERDLGEFIREGLDRDGFIVDIARNGNEAIERFEENEYDAILMDIMMPHLDGLSALKVIRTKGYKGGILLVTCKGQERDKLEGLNGGADDYIVKPFLMSELIARVRAVLRRTVSLPVKSEGSVLRVGDVEMDLLKREVSRGNKRILLTKKEFDLLECLMRRPGQVLSQTQLGQKVSSIDYMTNTNTIEVHIKNLRAKLDGKSSKGCIRTVRGCGYALEV